MKEARRKADRKHGVPCCHMAQIEELSCAPRRETIACIYVPVNVPLPNAEHAFVLIGVVVHVDHHWQVLWRGGFPRKELCPEGERKETGRRREGGGGVRAIHSERRDGPGEVLLGRLRLTATCSRKSKSSS